MTQQAVDFRWLVELAKQDMVGATDIAIWCGTCTTSQLPVLLDAWKLPSETMPYCIWEQISTIAFQRQQRPEHIAWLQRGRVFGEGGDFDIQRNGDQFDWRFIGDVHIKPPPGYAGESLWDVEGQTRYHRYTGQRVLLWGEWSSEANRWHEDRVAGADLSYPASPEWERVLLEYEVFSRTGLAEFVWFKRLIEWQGVEL